MTRHSEVRGMSALSVCRRRVARHSGQLFVIAVPLALAIVTTSVIASLLVLLGAEAVLLGVLPVVPAFRRRVHEQLAREARAAKLAERARLMPSISPCHRSELEELESRVGTIRLRTGCALDRDDWLGMDGLLTLYLRLAMAHRKSSEAAFSCAAAADIDRQLAMTEHARLFATEAARPRIEQHLMILRRRRELRASVEERRAVIAYDLAAIADLIRCLYEECVAADGACASSEVPDAIMDGLRNATTLSELALFRASYIDELESLDPGAGTEPEQPQPRLQPLDGTRTQVVPMAPHAELSA